MDGDKIINRTPIDGTGPDAALCKQICEDVRRWEKHWEPVFKRMRFDRRFCRGDQWPSAEKSVDGNYVANITLRHVKQRTAAVYARNPKIIFKPLEKLWFRLWDGNPETLQMAMARLQAAATGDPMLMAEVGPASPEDQALVEEVQIAEARKSEIKKIGDTLRLLVEYFAGEQNRPVKTQMKRLVQRAHTVGVAYVRPGFQRVTGRSPETEQALKDERRRLEKIERLSADIADGEVEPDDAEAARLRGLIATLEAKQEIVIRQGLTRDYPDPTSIIPDTGLTSILDFEGTSAVAEKYLLTPKRVEEVYGVDVKGQFNVHKDQRIFGQGTVNENEDMCAVYEVWNRDDGMIYVVCDGYPAFLVEPAEPDVYMERFYPWFTYAPNWTDDDESPFPPSDVQIIQDMQLEINRAGESVRDHRYAARPGHISTAALSPESAVKIQNRHAHDVINIPELAGKDVREILQPFPTSPIDPNLYNTGPALDDINRSVGSHEAVLGGISSGTATEVSIAESSRQSALTSSRDELDDLLTFLARVEGQILLREMDFAAVQEIVGPGAAWPEKVDRESVAKEVLLQVEAGSTGRPNQAQQIQNRERIMPLLLQVPGVSPRHVAKDLARAMDDNIDVDAMIELGLPSITSMNGLEMASARQGAQGQNNAPQPPGRGAGGMPRNNQGG